MDLTTQYADVLAEYMKNLALHFSDPTHPQMTFTALIDSEKHHYQLLQVGWADKRYIYQVLLHLELKPDGKIWIHFNQTEQQIDLDLQKYGIDIHDLVLGFRSAFMREIAV